MMVTTDPDSVPDQSKFINLRSTAGWGGGGGGGGEGRGGSRERIHITESVHVISCLKSTPIAYQGGLTATCHSIYVFHILLENRAQF